MDPAPIAIKILFPKAMFLIILFKSISFLSIIKLTLEFFAINFANEMYGNPNFIVSLAL